MHRLLGTSWVPYSTLITAVWMYGVALPITASDPGDQGRQIATSVCIWLFSVAHLLVMGQWFWYALHQRRRLSTKLTRAFFDLLVAHYHVVAALGFSIWLMDTSSNKDTFFSGIPPTPGVNDVYGVYAGDFLQLSVLLLNSAGITAVRAQPSMWLPALWAIFTSVSGVLLLVFLLSLLLQHLIMERLAEPALEKRPATQSSMPKFTSNFNLRQRPRIYSAK